MKGRVTHFRVSVSAPAVQCSQGATHSDWAVSPLLTSSTVTLHMPQHKKCGTSSLKLQCKNFFQVLFRPRLYRRVISLVFRSTLKSPHIEVSLHFPCKWIQNSTRPDLITEDILLEYNFLQWKIWETEQNNCLYHYFIHSIFPTNIKKLHIICFQKSSLCVFRTNKIHKDNSWV